MTLNRKPIRPRRSKPRRRAAPQEDRDWWEGANTLLMYRCGMRCDRCGRDLGTSVERHHRQRRAVGGDRLSNLLALHPFCHTYITEHPEEARANGWIVSVFGENGTPDPAEVPVRLPDGMLWLLRDDGTKTPAA